MLDENEKMKNIIKLFLKGETQQDIAYNAISNDDAKTLQILIDSGLKLQQGENYLFSAVDMRAKKCFDLLLNAGASKNICGRTYCDGKFIYATPMELACIIGQIDMAEKLVKSGMTLQNNFGEDILRKYFRSLKEDGCERLRSARLAFEKEHKNDTLHTII